VTRREWEAMAKRVADFGRRVAKAEQEHRIEVHVDLIAGGCVMGAPRELGMATAADEAAERRHKVAEYDEALQLLAERLGPSAKHCSLAEHLDAWVRPHGVGPVSEASVDELRLHACEADLAAALGLDPADTEPGWGEYIAAVERLRPLAKLADTIRDALGMANAPFDEVLTVCERVRRDRAERESAAFEPSVSIDDSTPEGILALLDAAAAAAHRGGTHHGATKIEAARDDVADYYDLPLRYPAVHRARVRELAKSEVERMADTLAAHGDAVLLGTLLADVRDLPGVLRAAIAGRGQGEDSALKRIAATALALSRTASKAGAF
jgi:hypothetical protein